MRAVKALVSLRISTDSPEPSLLAVISCAGPNIANYVNYTGNKGSLTLWANAYGFQYN